MKKISYLLAIIAFICILTGSVLMFTSTDTQSVLFKNQTRKTFLQNEMAYINENADYLYLSDIPYTYGATAWSNIFYDKTNANNLISMKVNNSNVNFKKGIWAHANSTLIYNLSPYDYDYFTAYIGLNTTASSSSNGVKFTIYVSDDNVNWEQVETSLPEVSKPGSNAVFVKVAITGKNYLKLIANDNGHNGSDHSVYGDAKLIKKDYSDNVTKTPEEYDELIKNAEANSSSDLELLLLQKELVSKFGSYQLKVLFEEGEDYKNTFNWLMNDIEMLRLYIMGGSPDGNYINSIKVLTDLYNTYKEDLSTEEVSASGQKLSSVYKKMMISLSLSHSRIVNFWISSNPPSGEQAPEPNPNISNAKNRYQIYKEMLAAQELDANFENLEVEEMRYIMGSQINDDEIKWMRSFAKSKNNNVSGYGYMGYKNVSPSLYRSDKYYAEDISAYEEKYKLTGFNVINQKYYPRLWMIMDTGGVCWQISNVGQNVASSMGLSSTIVGQPGHTAYFVLRTDNNGNGLWELWNNVGGWQNVNLSGYNGTRGYHTIRLLNGWGNGSYASGKQGSYILLGQAAMNDYENYVEAEEKVLLAKSYNGNLEKQEALYKEALTIQSFNLDAWIELINTYINNKEKTEEQLYQLAVEVTNNLTYYPLPMHDMLRLIKQNMSSPAYLASMTSLENRTLKTASVATAENIMQADVVRIMANYLLGTLDSKIATFSFDGEEAGIIRLADEYTSAKSTWDYSLDGGKTWKVVDAPSIKLTDQEIASINSKDDIKVHIIGANYEEENIYTIDITEGTPAENLYGNDLENKVIGTNQSMEWKIIPAEDDLWNSFSEKMPDLTGDKTIEVRNKATGTKLAGGVRVFIFTEDEKNPKHQYISIDNLNVTSFSSENVRANKNEYEYARNVIDGNINTHWHTSRVSTNDERYIVIQLAEELYLSGLDYVPIPNYNYGVIKNAIIYTSLDGENFTKVKEITDLPKDNSIKTIEFTPTKAKYLKVKVTKSYDYLMKKDADYFASVAMFNLYEDSTKDVTPTVSLDYSIREKTNQDVTVTLVNPSTEIIVTNNEGNLSHTFTENGSFTFEFKDKNDNASSITATVTWIDKTKPTATVTYSPNTSTNEDVTATIEFSEEVTILNENIELQPDETIPNKYTYLFTDNIGFCLEYIDQAGNKNQTPISVDFIDKDYPTATFTYDISTDTNKPVTATLIPSEEITVTNNNGSISYTFTENGTFTFIFKDKVGNYGSATAKVDWIRDEANVEIEYDTTNLTNQDVTATLFSDKKIEILNNNKQPTYTFTENGEFTFEYIDGYGEVKTITAVVDWIDKTPPKADIKYSTKDYTRDDVTVQLTNPSEEIKITNNGGKDTYTFTKNGEFTFDFVDKAKNVGHATAKVTWINKNAPHLDVTYSTTTLTNQDVTAKLSLRDGITITNNNGSPYYTFKDNGEFTFEYIDNFGNIGSTTAKVDWIDKVVLTAEIHYSTTITTAKEVIATLKTNKDIIVLNNEGNDTYTFTENGEFTFEFMDKVGTKKSLTAKVDWIDKNAPTAEIYYSNKDFTNKDVTVQLTNPSEEIKIINNDGKDTYTFTENGEFIFEIEDTEGNRASVVAIVTWIDKIVAEAEISYDISEKTDKNVTATITSNEDITILNNNQKNTYVFTENKSFIFQYMDRYGNIGFITAKVDWIDKNKPIIIPEEEVIKESPTTEVEDQTNDNSMTNSDQDFSSSKNKTTNTTNEETEIPKNTEEEKQLDKEKKKIPKKEDKEKIKVNEKNKLPLLPLTILSIIIILVVAFFYKKKQGPISF